MAGECKKNDITGYLLILPKEGNDVAGLFRTCLEGFFRDGIGPQARKLRDSFLEEKYRSRR